MSRPAAIAVLLAALSFGLHLKIARQFESVGFFDKRDTLFDADIRTRIEALSRGLHLGIKHPNLMAYFTPPIALVARAATALDPTGPTEEAVRWRLATTLVPLVSAIKSALVFACLLCLGFSPVQATIATLLEMMSFSTLIFGSIPESYGITAVALAAAYVLAASPNPELSSGRLALWLGVGVFATGVTVTNVAQVTLLFWAAAWRARPDPMAATLHAAAVGIAIFGITGVSAWGFDRTMVAPKVDVIGGATQASSALDRITKPFATQVADFVEPNSILRLERFPTAVANAFAPPGVETIPIKDGARRGTGLTLERAPNIAGLRDPLGLSLILLLIAGAISTVRPGSRLRPIGLASCGVLACSWLVSVWGRETLLYSQHWHLAAVVLIAGVMKTGRWTALMTAVLGVLALALAINNLALINAIPRMPIG